MTINLTGIQPLSNNRMWRGRRFKTAEYERFERDMLLLLPRPTETITGPVKIFYTFTFPDRRTRDISNLIKPLEDIIVKKGLIQDDSQVHTFTVWKRFGDDWGIEITILPLPTE